MEVRIILPCSGEMHWVRLRVKSWKQWEVLDSHCMQKLGRALGHFAECYQEIKKRTEDALFGIMRALKEFGPETAPILVEALGETNYDFRVEIYETLAGWGAECAIPALVVHSYCYPEARNALQTFSGKIIPLEEAIETLLNQGQDEIIKRAATDHEVLKTVARFGQRGLPVLFHSLEYPKYLGGELEYLSIFEQIGGEIAIACAKHATKLDAWLAPKSAVWMLGRLGALDEVEKILLSSGDSNVRAEACKVLARYGGKQYAPILRKIAEDTKEEFWVRDTAGRVLKKLEE